MNGGRDPSEEAAERKSVVVFILSVGSFGFSFVGLVALLLSPRFSGTTVGDELIVAGAVGLGMGIFLCVALVAVWFDMKWIERL